MLAGWEQQGCSLYATLTWPSRKSEMVQMCRRFCCTFPAFDLCCWPKFRVLLVDLDGSRSDKERCFWCVSVCIQEFSQPFFPDHRRTHTPRASCLKAPNLLQAAVWPQILVLSPGFISMIVQALWSFRSLLVSILCVSSSTWAIASTHNLLFF